MNRPRLPLARLRGGVAAAAIGVSLSACAGLLHSSAPRPLRYTRAPAAELAQIGRILVLPFRSENGVVADTERAHRAVSRELARLQRFELVPLNARAEEDELLLAAIARGRLATREAATLVERYRVDGLLIGTVTAERAYTPTHLGLRLELISLHDASIAWRVDAMFDSADADIEADVRHFAKTVQTADASMHGWRMTLLAPERFAAYVAHRLVATLDA